MEYTRLNKLYTCTKLRSHEVEKMIRTGEARCKDWEKTLQELKPNAWTDFQKKAENWDFYYHRIAGLKVLSELMNEAKGYVSLKKRGYRDIRFILKDKNKTPDIEGRYGTKRVILEVKTINPSEQNDEHLFWNSYAKEMAAKDIEVDLNEGIKKKLNDVCENVRKKFEDCGLLEKTGEHMYILFCVVELDSNLRPANEIIVPKLKKYIRSQLYNSIGLILEVV